MSYGARLPEPSSAARLACNATSRPNISRSSLISVLCTIVHTILTLALDISSSDGASATTAHNGEMTHPERAVMTQSQSAPSVPNLARENAAPADPAFVAKLQQAANLANENCDRATALAHTLSGQLREAQSRINQLELDADGLVEGLRAEVETVVGKLREASKPLVERKLAEQGLMTLFAVPWPPQGSLRLLALRQLDCAPSNAGPASVSRGLGHAPWHLPLFQQVNSSGGTRSLGKR